MKSGRNWATAAGPKAHVRIVGFIKDNGSSGATVGMIAALTKTSTHQARLRLEALVDRKVLVCRDDHYHLRPTEEAPDGR